MEMAEELYQHGLSSGPDNNVCKNHFSDKTVKRFISENGSKIRCDYCKKGDLSVDLETLMKFLLQTVRYYYKDPVDFAYFESSEGGYLIEHTDAWEILQDCFGLDIDDQVLFDDMADWIDYSRTYADEKAMYGEGHYHLPDTWDYFCYLVKHKVRYMFPNIRDDTDRLSRRPADILDKLKAIVNRYNLVKPLADGHQFWRCRQHSNTEEISHPSQICSPKAEFCINANRMSPAGVSMFYGAFEKVAALKETLDPSWKNSCVTTAKFELKKGIHVLDLSQIPALPSIFDINKRKRYANILFLRKFVTDLTKPIKRDGKVHIEYVPTQIVTEFFRYRLQKRIDGIIYPSSKERGKNAVVLFYDHDDSLRNLKFLDDSLITEPIDLVCR